MCAYFVLDSQEITVQKKKKKQPKKSTAFGTWLCTTWRAARRQALSGTSKSSALSH